MNNGANSAKVGYRTRPGSRAMDQGTPNQLLSGSRRVIKRPRLTRNLSATDARVILLVAPAGYGKTTLMREWLAEGSRPHAWISAVAASSDVAALSASVASSVMSIIPSAGAALHERLRITDAPDADVAVLAELLARDLADWPSNSWIALDDYHLLGEGTSAEDFVARLVLESPVRIIIGSRRRPSWATARRMLYGEVIELDQHALRMNNREATDILRTHTASRRSLLAQARG